MIVTRRRRRPLRLERALLPLAAFAALAFALLWPPSQHAIVSTIAPPFTFAAQQQQIADRDRTIQALSVRLEQQRATAAADDARVEQLRRQVAALAEQPHPPAPAVRGTPPAAAAAASGVLSAQPPSAQADRHLAATWAAMDPEKAAAVVQRLPDDDVNRVLALMDADAAAQIMNALPAGTAARLARAAQVPSGANR